MDGTSRFYADSWNVQFCGATVHYYSKRNFGNDLIPRSGWLTHAGWKKQKQYSAWNVCLVCRTPNEFYNRFNSSMLLLVDDITSYDGHE